MALLITAIEVNKTYIGKFGLKRKVLQIEFGNVRFLVTDIGQKPPPNFQLLKEYTVKLDAFANWAVEVE